MWNYLFFIAYLRWKVKSDFSGIESFVYSRLQEEDMCWVPFNKARELSMVEDGESQKRD